MMRKMDLRNFPAPRFTLWFIILALLLLPAAGRVLAQGDSGGATANSGQSAVPASLSGDFKTAIVIDAETGLVLVANNERVRRQPASMLKMMTELIVLDHIADGDLKMDEIVTVSANASRMGGSQVYLAHNEVFTVEELLEALAIHSANDAAVALAEHLAGSTLAFVDLMNMKAMDLGLLDTEFHSVHGLPAGWGQKPDLTTARDMAILGQELVKHPRALVWASTKTAPFRDGKFTLYNPNKLVGTYRGLDGIKTGYTGPAGFCVTASAIQKGRRLISVVMGCPSDRARATETTRLLTYGFNAFRQVAIIPEAGVALPDLVTLKGGKKKLVEIAYGETLTVSVPRNREGDVVVRNRLPESLQAPLVAHQEIGRAVAILDGLELGSVPLVVLVDYPKGNWLDRLMN